MDEIWCLKVRLYGQSCWALLFYCKSACWCAKIGVVSYLELELWCAEVGVTALLCSRGTGGSYPLKRTVKKREPEIVLKRIVKTLKPKTDCWSEGWAADSADSAESLCWPLVAEERHLVVSAFYQWKDQVQFASGWCPTTECRCRHDEDVLLHCRIIVVQVFGQESYL